MANRNDENGISRREFATRVGAAAAGIAVGGELFTGPAEAGPRRGPRGAARQRPHPRRERSRRDRQHRHPRPGQFAQARLRAPAERRDQDALRHRREPGAGADQRRAPAGRRHLQARLRPGSAARARRQGHRRRRHRHAQPLARARHDLGAAGRQARLRREAFVAHRVGRPQDGRGGGALQQDRAGRHHESQPAGGARRDQVHPRGRPRQGLHGARPVLQAAPGDRQVSRMARWRPARSTR